ncbi:hypothetical protein NL676_023780 [Syzygium grande]|nr:hypothetical protein NL676_023780 [Syzygium grande]
MLDLGTARSRPYARQWQESPRPAAAKPPPSGRAGGGGGGRQGRIRQGKTDATHLCDGEVTGPGWERRACQQPRWTGEVPFSGRPTAGHWVTTAGPPRDPLKLGEVRPRVRRDLPSLVATVRRCLGLAGQQGTKSPPGVGAAATAGLRRDLAATRATRCEVSLGGSIPSPRKAEGFGGRPGPGQGQDPCRLLRPPPPTLPGDGGLAAANSEGSLARCCKSFFF